MHQAPHASIGIDGLGYTVIQRMRSLHLALCCSKRAFESAGALLNIVGRVNLDSYINGGHLVVIRNPLNQSALPTCYAHATAAVKNIHMALSRIIGREGGYAGILTISGVK